MNAQYFTKNEYAQNVVVICQDNDLSFHLKSFFKFIESSAEVLTADRFIESIPGFRDKKMSMIVFEGKENVKKILNKNFMLRRDHPDLQFIILLDELPEVINAEEHFEYVKYMHKEEVMQKISSLLGYAHSSGMQSEIPVQKKYETKIYINHKVNAYA
jgi:hypothetical protein